MIGWYGTATDIQALKEIQSSLRESEERLRVTMDSATDYAIITTDIDGIITRMECWAQNGYWDIPGMKLLEVRQILYLRPKTGRRRAGYGNETCP